MYIDISSFRIGIVMEKLQEVKVKIIFLFERSHWLSRMCLQYQT